MKAARHRLMVNGASTVMAALIILLGSAWPGLAVSQEFPPGGVSPSYPGSTTASTAVTRKKKKKTTKKTKRLPFPRRRAAKIPSPPVPPAQPPVATPTQSVPPPASPPEPEADNLGMSLEDDDDEGGASLPALNGFFESRAMARHDDTTAALNRIAPLPTAPAFLVLANLQVRARTESERLGVAGDFSFYGADHAPKTLALVNEAYVDVQIANPLRILVGRRRLVWGTGLAWNPTDVINPPKDVLDPEWQRTGAFLLPLVDLSLGPVIGSAFVSPLVKSNEWGFPEDLRFDQAIYGARIYALLGGVDTSLIYYRDQRRNQNLVGLTASGFVNDTIELHTEVLGRPAALVSVPKVNVCGGPVGAGGHSVTALMGTRAHFSDESFGVLEYIYDSNALDGANFRRFVQSLPCIVSVANLAGPAAISVRENPLGLPVDSAVLLRQHHAFLSYTRPRLTASTFSDVEVSGRAAVSIEDLSAILQLEVGYHPSANTTVGGRISYWLGNSNSEMGIWPGRVLGMLQLRISY